MDNFTTKFTRKEVDIYGNPDTRDISSIEAQIDWTCEIEKRDWGIKSISLYTTKVNVTITYEDEEMNEHEVTVDVSDWKIDSNISVEYGCPQELCLDFKSKEITIN